MADLMAGDGMGNFPLEQWYLEMPICTRVWVTATIVISVLVQCKVLGPLQLFYSMRSVFVKNQLWRLATTFCYFGPLSFELLLHVFFLQRYSRLLEESAGRSPARYTWLLLFAATALLAIAPLASLPFLGQALSSTLIYIWSRRNPDTRLSLLGLFVFRAPFLSWVLIAFAVVMYGTVPKDEIAGVVVGHVWYFFDDVWPAMHDGYRPLDPPAWWCRLFERPRGTEGSPAAEVDAVRVGGAGELPAAPELR